MRDGKRGEQKGRWPCSAPLEMIDNNISQTANELFLIYGVSLSCGAGVPSEAQGWGRELINVTAFIHLFPRADLVL